jgi:hypothetical protein
MKKAIALTLLCGFSVALVAGLSGCAWMPWQSKEDPTVVPFKTIMSGSYQSFLKNWDDERHPVFCTLMRNSREWDEWMHPAAVMGGKKSFGPPSSFFDNRQLLLVARVMQAPDAAERPHVFTPLSVTLRDGVLRANYLYRKPASGATYSIKDYLLLSIPKERFTTGKVQFFENDKKVCELDR